MKYLDPKADLTFKKIFGNHPDRLKNLLNTLQSLNEDELIQHDGKEEGRAEGRAEGMSQRSLEIARNLLSLGLPVDQITQATGLTEEEIELLKES